MDTRISAIALCLCAVVAGGERCALGQEPPAAGPKGSYVVTLRADDEDAEIEDLWCRLQFEGTLGLVLLAEGSHPECTVTVERSTLGRQGDLRMRVVRLAPPSETDEEWVATDGLDWRAEEWQLVGVREVGGDGLAQFAGVAWVTVAEEGGTLETWRGRFVARPGESPGGDPFAERDAALAREAESRRSSRHLHDLVAHQAFLASLGVSSDGSSRASAPEPSTTAASSPLPLEAAEFASPGPSRYAGAIIALGLFVGLIVLRIRIRAHHQRAITSPRTEDKKERPGPEFLLDPNKLAKRRGELDVGARLRDERMVEFFFEGLGRLQKAEADAVDQAVQAADDLEVAGHLVIHGAGAVEQTIPTAVLFGSPVERTVPLEEIFSDLLSDSELPSGSDSDALAETAAEGTVPISELFAGAPPEVDRTTPIGDLFVDTPQVEKTVPVDLLFDESPGGEE